MLRSGCFLLFAFVASGFVIPVAVQAADSRVIDNADFFSKSAIAQATQKLREIKSRYKVEVVVETFASIPEKAQYNPAEKNRFFRRWAQMCATDEGLKGIYVLICKNPGHLQIEPDEATARKAFTLAERDALVTSALRLLGQKQYDPALLDIANTIESTVERNLGSRTSVLLGRCKYFPMEVAT